MSKRSALSLVVAGLGFLLSLLPLSSTQLRPNLPQKGAQDIVQLVQFQISPAAGGSLLFRIRLRNLTNHALTVPWQVQKGSVIAANATASAPSGESESSATWNPGVIAAGTVVFTAIADPSNVLGEPAAARANNQMTASYQFTVSAPPLATRFLEYDKAKMAGAGFFHNPGAPQSCALVGVFDYKTTAYFDGSGVPMEPDPTRPPAVLFALFCATAGQASPKAYAGFQLKNGWKIKAIDKVFEKKEHGDWQPLTWPSIGSASPDLRIRLSLYPPGGMVYVAFRITIEGPRDADPYK